MARLPTAERPPSGLNSYWTHVWNHALNVLQEQGTWAWELKPLLDEYVFALRGAQDARKGFAWLDALSEYANRNADEVPEIAWESLRQIAGALPMQWDRHTKRAAALADALILTPAARKRHGIGNDPQAPEVSVVDQLAQRRAGRAG
jgi:hypothetical protein